MARVGPLEYHVERNCTSPACLGTVTTMTTPTMNTTLMEYVAEENCVQNCSGITEEPPLAPPFDVATMVLIAIGASFASIVTIGGNLLVIIAFYRERRLRCISNYFVLSMAVADLIVGFFSMPLFTTYLLLGYWPLGPHICDVWLSLDYMCCAASVLGIFLISVDRYGTLSSPMTYRNIMTRKRAIALIIVSWIISMLLFGVPIIGWQYFEGERRVKAGDCEVQFLLSSAYFTTGSIILIYWLPLFIILVLYTRIYLLTRKLTKSQARIIGRISIRNRGPKGRTETTTLSEMYPSRTENGTHRVSAPTDSNDDEHEAGPLAPDTVSSEAGKDFDNVAPLPKMCNHSNVDDNSDEYDVNSNGGNKTPDSYSKRTNWSTSMRGDNHSIYSDCDNMETQPMNMKRPSSSSSLNADRKSLRSAVVNMKQKDHHLGKALSSVLVNLREAKAVRTLSTILGLFILCWTPYSILVIVKGFCPHCVDDGLYSFSYWLCYINSTCNPVCYAFANRDFKVAFKKILTCGRRRYEWKDVF